MEERHCVPNVRVFLVHANHHTLVTRATDNRSKSKNEVDANKNKTFITYGKTARGASSPKRVLVDGGEIGHGQNDTSN